MTFGNLIHKQTLEKKLNFCTAERPTAIFQICAFCVLYKCLVDDQYLLVIYFVLWCNALVHVRIILVVLHAYCVLTALLLRARCVLAACLLHAFCLLSFCLLCACCVLAACLLHACCVLACCMHTACLLDVYFMNFVEFP